MEFLKNVCRKMTALSAIRWKQFLDLGNYLLILKSIKTNEFQSRNEILRNFGGHKNFSLAHGMDSHSRFCKNWNFWKMLKIFEWNWMKKWKSRKSFWAGSGFIKIWSLILFLLTTLKVRNSIFIIQWANEIFWPTNDPFWPLMTSSDPKMTFNHTFDHDPLLIVI